MPAGLEFMRGQSVSPFHLRPEEDEIRKIMGWSKKGGHCWPPS
jgi:hypothetical protein